MIRFCNPGTQGGGQGSVLNTTPLHTVELSSVNILEHFVTINVVNTKNKNKFEKKILHFVTINVCDLFDLTKFAN